ncbi:PilZ domain-containing protein [Marinobacter sp. X15-166B]|uniref:PilZ domain-containing protein n=1 Tax=Marinobacter sp. X15-166B TaxID=1897620 RepID=UPI00085C76CC|nr:PilZ domain-containing protein [Marinobacter sp. X15-166B]OEY67216.1 hypothetical protein BG841_12670 [Marinobacter sp. X15-166B]
MSSRIPTLTPSERRDYFRIDDRIGLEVRILPSDQSSDTIIPFDDGPLGELRAELKRLDQDIRQQLSSLAETDRLLSTLIKSLNSKVDTLARIMAFDQNPLQPKDWNQVTLSEGGLAFEAPENRYQPDDLLVLRMTLSPELFQPEAVARVIKVTAGGAGNDRVHTRFSAISENSRQQIARHVMRWQVRQRQK